MLVLVARDPILYEHNRSGFRLSSGQNVARDPNDDKFLATALATGADFLASEDKNLLVPGEYQGTRLIDCRTFLRLPETPDTGG